MHAHLHRAGHFLKPHGKLHLIAAAFNPIRFLSRYTLFKDFVEMAQHAGAVVHIAEVAFGARPFEVSDACNERTVQFRTSDEVWHKEAILNAAVERLPADWEYVAWVDADVTFTNPQWVQETIQQLQHFAVVQMFTDAIDLCPSQMQIARTPSFAAGVLDGKVVGVDGDYYYAAKKFHPGYAWAARRDAWDAMGGLLDINIVGGGDYQMAQAIIGQADRTIPQGSTAGYRRSVMAWQAHAASLKRSLGAVPGTVMHHWHGAKANRGYHDRWKILTGNKFDPTFDLKRDWQGLWKLSGDKPKLRDELIAYFRGRQEDSIDV